MTSFSYPSSPTPSPLTPSSPTQAAQPLMQNSIFPGELTKEEEARLDGNRTFLLAHALSLAPVLESKHAYAEWRTRTMSVFVLMGAWGVVISHPDEIPESYVLDSAGRAMFKTKYAQLLNQQVQFLLYTIVSQEMWAACGVGRVFDFQKTGFHYWKVLERYYGGGGVGPVRESDEKSSFTLAEIASSASIKMKEETQTTNTLPSILKTEKGNRTANTATTTEDIALPSHLKRKRSSSYLRAPPSRYSPPMKRVKFENPDADTIHTKEPSPPHCAEDEVPESSDSTPYATGAKFNNRPSKASTPASGFNPTNVDPAVTRRSSKNSQNDLNKAFGSPQFCLAPEGVPLDSPSACLPMPSTSSTPVAAPQPTAEPQTTVPDPIPEPPTPKARKSTTLFDDKVTTYTNSYGTGIALSTSEERNKPPPSPRTENSSPESSNNETPRPAKFSYGTVPSDRRNLRLPYGPFPSRRTEAKTKVFPGPNCPLSRRGKSLRCYHPLPASVTRYLDNPTPLNFPSYEQHMHPTERDFWLAQGCDCS